MTSSFHLCAGPGPSVQARILLRYIAMSRGPWGLGWSSRGDMKFLAACIIAGVFDKPYYGVL